VRTTSVEHDIDEKAPAHAADLPQRDSGHPAPLHARMLLGLQAMAGNAAVANLIETRKPAEISPPPVTAEAASTEETTVAAPRPGETDPTRLPPGEGTMGTEDAGTAIEESPARAVPDVSAADPATGLARVSYLPPAQLLSSLGMVSTAVGRQTAEEHERLWANRPQRQRHPGAERRRQEGRLRARYR